MNRSYFLVVFVAVLCIAANVYSKIILPHKLRYLENMLSSDVMAKAKKIRQRIQANPGIQDNEKDWPLLLAKYQEQEVKGINKFGPSHSFKGLYGRRYSGI